jgi:hypothetical protein
MIRSRLGLKALVLSGLVLGLMAFASSAQAELNAKWLVNGQAVTLTNLLLPPIVIKEIENLSATLEFTTKGGTGVLILCKEAEFDEGGLLLAHGGISLGRLKFRECVTLLNEVLSAKCTPHTEGEPAGLILTRKATGLIVLDKLPSGEVDDLVLIKPDEKETFAVIELGASCAIGESVDVKGELWLKDCKGNSSFLTEAKEHLIEEALSELTALGQPAKILGSAVVELGGAEHKGLKWAGDPA